MNLEVLCSLYMQEWYWLIQHYHIFQKKTHLDAIGLVPSTVKIMLKSCDKELLVAMVKMTVKMMIDIID